MGLRSQYHQAYSLWLFTYSDLKTIVGPKTTFGLCSSLSAEIFGVSPKSTRLILARTPLILLWTWINLLPFAIDNQRQPLAIHEDGINKPWRPMPSGRVSPQQAKRWMLGLYPAAIVFSFCFGGLRQCVVLILLGLWYNDLSGADKNPMIRNFHQCMRIPMLHIGCNGGSLRRRVASNLGLPSLTLVGIYWSCRRLERTHSRHVRPSW